MSIQRRASRHPQVPLNADTDTDTICLDPTTTAGLPDIDHFDVNGERC
ncbi:hypothetical protein [Streptosporangium sp. NPDC002721]